MADIELKSFPFDSMKVLNEESGQMENDREYEAQIYRNYFRKFLSNGVYFGHYKDYGENSMKVELDVGLNIKVLKGAGIIEGADYENEEEQIIILERPSAGNRIDRIVVQMNASLDTRKTKLIVKQGTGETPAELIRTENIYEICLAEVTVKSESNLTEEDINDTRLDKNLCGIVNSLISIDGEEIYQNFKNYIATIIDNLVLKNQDNTIEGNLVADSVKDINNKGLSANDFTDAYKTKLDGIASGATKNTATATTSASGLMSPTDKAKLDGISAGATRNTTIATTSASGLMSATDKTKLNGIASGANKVIVEDSVESTSKENAFSANKGRELAIDIAIALAGASNASELASEVYNKLSQFFSTGGTINGDTTINGNLICSKAYTETVSGSPNVYVTQNHYFRRSTSSSKRYKKNITKEIEDRLNPEKLYDAQVVQFKYKNGYLSKDDKRNNENFLGFIVEDLLNVYEPAIDYNEDGTPEMWNYKALIPAMLYLIQKQHKEIEELKNIVKEG